MAYNGSDQYSDIEALISKTEFEGESKDNKNLGNDDCLTGDVNVQNEIWRGKKLREKKPKADVMEKELIVPNINFFECFVKQPRVRKGHLETSKNNTSHSALRSRCTCTRTTSAASSYLAINRVSRTTMQTTVKKGKRCPMRIAELAVPTKRQCIETWRNKSDVLPEFMVDRLKQHVMDQRPIVKIPEAIYCFQNGRRVSSKKWLSSNHEPKETPKNINHMDTRMLCIVFAHKVAKKLARPINLTMNSEDHKTTTSLEKLSAIVSSDLTKIMSKCNATKGQQFKAIQSDVSHRITVWITGILEDLSYKLLEEDLRVKTETEAQIKKMLEFSGQVVTIIETIIEQESYMKSKDLEDEEGPVLDFIDDVVDTVMNVCEPPQLHIDTDSNLSSSTKDVLLEAESQKLVETIESAADKMSKLEEIFNSETSSRVLTKQTDDGNENLTDSEHFRKEIINIINNIITKESGDDISNGSGDDIENGSRNSSKAEMEHNTNDENNEGISPEAGIEHDVNDDILPETEKQQGLNDEILPKAGSEHDVNDENNDEILREAEKEQDTKDDNNEGISSEAGIEHDLNDEILPQTEKQQDLNDEILPEAEKQKDIKDENNVGISPEAGIEHDTNDENFDQIDENLPDVDQNNEASDNAAETHSNVSERFQIFPDDSDDDKNSKKVMFPKKDLVNRDNPADQINTSTTEEPTPEPVEHKRAQWNRQTNKFNIMFAEPNQNLLSDADEPWPAQLGDRPMLKVSESASKSVSSLGRITENDEKHMSSPEDEDSITDKGTGDTVLQVSDIIEKLDNILVIEKHHTASEPSEPLITVYIDISSPEPGETQVDSKILDEKYMGKTITVPKPCHDKPVEEPYRLEENQTDSGESELIRRGSTTDRTEDDETPSHKSQRVDYGWKVHPKTAPSWVISWGQDRGEPSEDSIPIQIRPTKVSEIELRKWCKELEKAFTNLDMWSNWISATCKEGLSVLQQKEWIRPALAQKAAINWMRLTRNVHKDALLWTKLFQRTDLNFTRLKKKYNNIEFSSNEVPSILNRTIFEKMREFEELSAKLHKMIVAAEYCAMCKCDKTKPRYHSNKNT